MGYNISILCFTWFVLEKVESQSFIFFWQFYDFGNIIIEQNIMTRIQKQTKKKNIAFSKHLLWLLLDLLIVWAFVGSFVWAFVELMYPLSFTNCSTLN